MTCLTYLTSLTYLSCLTYLTYPTYLTYLAYLAYLAYVFSLVYQQRQNTIISGSPGGHWGEKFFREFKIEVRAQNC